VFFAGLPVLAALFWAAFILTRPLGATVGDFLDKPTSHGGLTLSRPLASGVILALIVVLILILPQRSGRHPERCLPRRRSASAAVTERQELSPELNLSRAS
jgi:uncharacterized membrane-anchored protein